MNIRVFKLVDGTELIGRLQGGNLYSDLYVVNDPLEIKYRVGMDGMATAVMTKYNYFGEEKVIRLNATGVITHYLVMEKYTKIYEEALEDAQKQQPEEPPKKSVEASAVIVTSNNTVH